MKARPALPLALLALSCAALASAVLTGAALIAAALAFPDYSLLKYRSNNRDQKISRIKTTNQTIIAFENGNGSVQFKVSLADSWFSRARGLQNVSYMEADQGMLFIYKNAALRQFWMKNTRLPLDIVFLDDQRRVVHIVRNTTPFSQKPIRSFAPAKYVVEINAGTAISLSIGDEMTLASSQRL